MKQLLILFLLLSTLNAYEPSGSFFTHVHNIPLAEQYPQNKVYAMDDILESTHIKDKIGHCLTLYDLNLITDDVCEVELFSMAYYITTPKNELRNYLLEYHHKLRIHDYNTMINEIRYKYPNLRTSYIRIQEQKELRAFQEQILNRLMDYEPTPDYILKLKQKFLTTL